MHRFRVRICMKHGGFSEAQALRSMFSRELAMSVASVWKIARVLALVGSCSVVGACSGGWQNPVTRPVTVEPKAATTTARSDDSIRSVVLPGVAGEPDIRVRLLSSTPRAKFGVAGGGTGVFVTTSQLAQAGKPVTRLAPPVEVELSEAGWQLKDVAGVIARFDRNAEVVVGPDENLMASSTVGVGQPMYAGGNLAVKARQSGLGGPMLTVNSLKYTGRMRLLARTDTGTRNFDVIEELGLEDYLKGVVSAEMLKNWPLEAYRVQAVAARSYAIHERARSRAAGARFDVEASVADQAYNGSVEQPLPAQAVADTRGIVLTWGGNILRAYYSSTSGGRPASAKDTWPTGKGYEYNLAGPLQAQAREEYGSSSPWYKWTIARTLNDVTTRIRAFGKEKRLPVANLTSIATIQPLGFNAGGRPNKYLITQTGGGAYTLGSEELRWALNTEVAGLTKIEKANRCHSGDIEVVITGDVVRINGRGFGHGVGMDQWATKELADKGEPWKKIIMMFYPGADVSRAY
jgi:stage II sporulation protein D